MRKAHLSVPQSKTGVHLEKVDAGTFNSSSFSFPSTGGVTVSNHTLSPIPHRRGP